MDLQNYLEKVCLSLMKNKPNRIKVYIHNPRKENSFLYCVVINVRIDNSRFRGSSTSRTLQNAFIKALSELGENIIVEKYNFESRSGIAGGFIKSNAINRAKAELIERDAFIFHYRNLVPFEKNETNSGYSVFNLNSISKKFYVTLTMNQDYLAESDQCLMMGIGCESSSKRSSEKSFLEYSTVCLNHLILDGCGDKYMESIGVFRKSDFHHAQSKSDENKEIFKILCESPVMFEERSFDESAWQVRVLDSPVKFFSYVRVEHSHLLKMIFGSPEPMKNFNKPVYHPFW